MMTMSLRRTARHQHLLDVGRKCHPVYQPAQNHGSGHVVEHLDDILVDLDQALRATAPLQNAA